LLIADYANNFTTLTDEKADEIAKAMLKNNMSYEKLYAKYYGKAKAVLGAVDAAKFIQLENALHTAVRSETQDAIPFIGEIDRSKKH
jgi:ATP-dependent protease HslVU (ClpYQ) ATPase subunit